MSETIPKSFIKIGDGPPQKCSVLPEYSLQSSSGPGQTFLSSSWSQLSTILLMTRYMSSCSTSMKCPFLFFLPICVHEERNHFCQSLYETSSQSKFKTRYCCGVFCTHYYLCVFTSNHLMQELLPPDHGRCWRRTTFVDNDLSRKR